MPRVIVWAAHLALPLVGLWLLLSQPGADEIWQHHEAHFWLVMVVAAINVVVGVAMSVAAKRRGDGRLFLVSLVFLAAAGFLFAHALATPGVLIGHPNAGFDQSMAVGLIIGSVLAVLSSLRLPGTITRWQSGLRIALGLLLFVWIVWSLSDLPPLSRQDQIRDVEGPLVWVSWAAVVLYAVAAIRFYLLYKKSPSAVLISVVTSFVLLAEAMVTVTLADKWRLSWWEWHLILTAAFLFVAYSAYVQYRREGSAAGLFDGIALAATNRQIRQQYEKALEELVAALQESEQGAAPERLAARMAERFGLTEKQAEILDRAAAALVAERELSGQLKSLVAVGEQAEVQTGEDEFIRKTIETVRDSFGTIEIALKSDGTLEKLDGALPLTVKGQLAGAVAISDKIRPEVRQTLAHQLSIGLENARLYGELSTLFRQYMSPDVAAALLADPDQAALGGRLVDVTALFADLRGFTTFSEAVEPGDIVEMLNRYHGVAVPCILDNGGTIVQFVGDALLALFNAPARQDDHEARAVRAALQMQDAVREIAEGHPDWPRFRVGANTGPALVGNIGSELLRGFNAMGDAVNVAARLQTIAEPGQVVIGGVTYDAIAKQVTATPLGELEVKGRVQTVRAYVVEALA
ncbi:adenylate/guanylate cyclase domain-containing protein [Dactylosporangium sp. NPDC051541]|uniref:adenylate/guanylate cyclase domain-containing protein n=1 Tax=Dactylosporangium sp. NPDC051541 TaxID=3363977 RepID=UPI00379453A5